DVLPLYATRPGALRGFAGVGERTPSLQGDGYGAAATVGVRRNLRLAYHPVLQRADSSVQVLPGRRMLPGVVPVHDRRRDHVRQAVGHAGQIRWVIDQVPVRAAGLDRHALDILRLHITLGRAGPRRLRDSVIDPRAGHELDREVVHDAPRL